METLILVLTLFFGLMIFLTFIGMATAEIERKQKEEYEKKRNIRTCPPHRWTYHPVHEKLSCINCNLTPGVNEGEDRER